MRLTGAGRTLVLAAAMAILVGARSSAVAALDDREIVARQKYAAGEFSEALQIFARLYAEDGDPIHLRNVARCHQKLRHFDQAIDAFEWYLHRGKVDDKEKAEIEGWIRELKEQKAQQVAIAQQQAAAAAAAAAAAPPPAAVQPPAAVSLTAVTPVTQAVPVVTAVPAEPVRSPFYSRWWFWTALGAVAAGTAAGIAIAYSNRGVVGDCHGLSGCATIGD